MASTLSYLVLPLWPLHALDTKKINELNSTLSTDIGCILRSCRGYRLLDGTMDTVVPTLSSAGSPLFRNYFNKSRDSPWTAASRKVSSQAFTPVIISSMNNVLIIGEPEYVFVFVLFLFCFVLFILFYFILGDR